MQSRLTVHLTACTEKANVDKKLQKENCGDCLFLFLFFKVDLISVENVGPYDLEETSCKFCTAGRGGVVCM